MGYFPRATAVWCVAEDFIALQRKSRGNAVYENVEAMVALEERLVARHRSSLYPRVPARERFGHS